MSLKHITGLFSEEENEAFRAIGYTIGGMMVFPGNRIEGKWTINQARGCLQKISDRLDLTLECIRRYYLGQRSPLGETLARYRDFFALFKSFSGYVNFFMLQDLVTDDCSAVMFFMPFDDFKTSLCPEGWRLLQGVPTAQHRVHRSSKPSDRPIRGRFAVAASLACVD